jgi:phosphopantothenoylcysteine decarboxylase / phosphopantothenate---cysteine ligase
VLCFFLSWIQRYNFLMETISLLSQKRIVLGASGSIAVYKALDLASKLTQAGALIDVIMTQAAHEFVTPLSFQAVTGRPVYTDMWQTNSGGGLPTHIAHVGLGEDADLFAVVPATANSIAKLAHGFAEDLLSVTALAARCPLLLAPAMDGAMYEHPATQANLKILVERGAYLIEPEEGRFASGLIGKGRLPETPSLMGHIRRALGKKGALAGRKVIVTAGGTREALDPVRFISNHSSGKQGYALAQAAIDAGADVSLISSVDLPTPVGATLIKTHSANSILEHVLALIPSHDALIMAAAIADFRPAAVSEQKIKKKDDAAGLSLELTRNPDILQEVSKQRPPRLKVVVGFAAESESLLENALSKVQRKGLDFIVANDISAKDAGFAVDTNRVTLLDKHGKQESLPLMSKAAVAEHIIAKVAALLG